MGIGNSNNNDSNLHRVPPGSTTRMGTSYVDRRQRRVDAERRQAALRADAAEMKRQNAQRRAEEAEEAAARENARHHKEVYNRAKEAEAALARMKETESVKAQKALANANAALANIETIMKNSGSRSEFGSRSNSKHFLSNVLTHSKSRPQPPTSPIQGGRRNTVKRRTIKKRRHQ